LGLGALVNRMLKGFGSEPVGQWLCIFRVMKRILYSLGLVALAFSVQAQGARYRNLVLEGGGIRGFAYTGAFQVLDSLNILQQIERVGGTSAGAIQASLLAVGYTPEEIMEIALDVPLRKLNDGGLLRGPKRLKKNFGWYKGEKMGTWIEALIEKKTGNANITFAELYRDRAVKGYKELYITGTDLTYQCMRVFSHETYPNMRIKDAVRISASIPIYFGAVLIDDQGKVYKEPDPSKKLHVMADGAVMSNYPIFLFDSTKYMSGVTIPVNHYAVNPETLGLLMEMPEMIEHRRNEDGTYPLPINSMRDYVKALYITLIDKSNPDGSDSNAIRRTIAISNMNLSGRIRKISRETLDDFVECGREGVRNFFERNTLANSKK
jgi:NTE family protein